MRQGELLGGSLPAPGLGHVELHQVPSSSHARAEGGVGDRDGAGQQPTSGCQLAEQGVREEEENERCVI